jgi:hypothetical protein
VPFLVIGSLSVVAGGLVAAVSRPTGFGLGPWLAAFLVLVAGVAQISLGVGQAWLTTQRPRPSTVRTELWAWNAGVVGTIVGTIGEMPLLTTVGGIATIVALAGFLAAVGRTAAGPRWARTTYVVGAGLLLVSTLIGLGLAWSGDA